MLEGEGLEPDARWSDALERAFDDQRRREAHFPDVTVNDRITAAFEAMAGEGLIALENAGYTRSDGWDDVREVADGVPDAFGGVFYHGQDVEQALAGEGLNVRFGAFSGRDDDAREVARRAIGLLEAHGVPTRWSGDVGRVVTVAPFAWRRRRRDQADG